MVNVLALILVSVMTLFSTVAQAQPVTASIDRTEITRGETVTLTLRVDGAQGNVPMDLTPLEEDFELVGTRTSSQLRSINNRTEMWIDYYLSLFPRSEGQLEIPPLQVAGVTTQSLSVNVLPRSDTRLDGQELFLEAVIDKDRIYVQEQLLFSIRLYYTINGIRNPVFTELNMPDTVIQNIGSPNQYEKLVDGVRYGVYEKQYAIFPQRSGTLTIPDIMFRGEVTDGSSRYVFRNLATRTITSFTEGHEIEVLEKPADYPADAIWLPANELTISQRWDNDFSNVRVGDAVGRVIRVEATGLDGAALPPLQLSPVDTVNIYPDPASIDRAYIDGNVVGTRVEAYQLVMTESGTVRVPGISLPWFDVDTNEIKYATLDDVAISVGPVRSSAADSGQQQTQDGSAGDPMALPSDDPAASLIDSRSPPLWVLVLAAALTALVFAFVWHTRRRQVLLAQATPLPEVAAPMYRRGLSTQDEASAFQELSQACAQNHLPAVRLALIGWGRQYFQDSDLHSLDDVARRADNEELRALGLRLQQALYGSAEHDSKADVRRILELVSSLRNERNKELNKAAKEARYALPPLYRN